jgi:hypothetical protein
MDAKRRRNLIIAIIIVAIIAIIANVVAQQQKSPSFMQPVIQPTYSPEGILLEPVGNDGDSGFWAEWKTSVNPAVSYFSY